MKALLNRIHNQPQAPVPFPYNGMTRWAEPDVDAAAKALRRLYDDPALRRQLGERGHKTIREHFAAENFKKSVEAFLLGRACEFPVRQLADSRERVTAG